MGQGHGERLSALDAAFLQMESPALHMHVGGIFVFEPPQDGVFSFERFLRLMRSRLHLVPRYRQKLAFPPLNIANPIWVDDPDFDLAYHVRHAGLPAPGTHAQLLDYAAGIFSRQLDRSKPLWELYVIEGLDRGGYAIFGKNHHAMIDGISGLDIITVLLDVAPEVPDELPAPQPWVAEPTPSGYEMATSALRGLAESPGDAVDRLRGAVSQPAMLARRAFEVGRGVASFARASIAHLAPRTVINQHPGVNRRIGTQRVSLEPVKAIKNAFGVKVNDVILTLVADTAGRYLRHRGESTRGLQLRAMVPVSVRSDDQRLALGNKVAATFVDLPVDEMDPAARLELVAERMRGLKSSKSAVGADFLLNLTEFAPPTLHAMGARVAASSRLFNFVVTNVPGPQFPIYCLGSRLEAGYPLVPLASFQSLAIGVTSLDGWLNFGFTVDYDSIPDPGKWGEFVLQSLAELLRSAEARAEQHERLLHAPREPGEAASTADEAVDA